MSAILDQGSLLFATSAVIIVSLLLGLSLRGALSIWSAFLPLLALSVVYVPGTLLLTNLFTRQGGLSVVFQRDYSPLLTCAAMAWTAINMPIVVVGWLLPLPIVRVVVMVAYLYFAVLMIFAVRTVFGTETRVAVGVVSVSWIPLLAAVFLMGTPQFHLAVAHLAVPAVFCLLLSSWRVREPGSRAAQPATLPPDARSGGCQPT
jgi:hypothetical protein